MKPRRLFLSRARSSMAGFTIVELMVVVAISAVLLGIAAPSFVQFIRGQAVKTAASDINASLMRARSEAIKRNNNVVLTQATGGWANGWTVTTTLGGTTTTLFEQSAYKNITVTGPAADVTYAGSGRLSGTTTASFQITGSDSTRCVTVSLSGVTGSKKGAC